MNNTPKIYFVRHGYTDANANGVILGDNNYPLNELGRNQADAAGADLKSRGVKFDRVYASPYKRAIETAERICKIVGYTGKIILDERLRERDFHDFVGMRYAKRGSTPTENVDFDIVDFIYNREKKYDKSESVEQCETRVHDFIRDLRTHYGGQNILCASHSLAMAHTRTIDKTPEYDDYRPIANGEILEINNGGKQ